MMKHPRETAVHCFLEVHAAPGSRRDEIVGMVGGALKVKLAARPVDGRANAALTDFLAEKLGCSRSAVVLERGRTSRRKVVRIEGMDLLAVLERLRLGTGL